MLTSRLCTQAECESDGYREWCRRMRQEPRLHRKPWEFYVIARALFERGMLAPERRGVGFGVGEEPLPALFADYGCSVVATDMDAGDAARAGWLDTGQFASGLDRLNKDGICDAATFGARVTLRNVDMNAVPDDLSGFDFTWSACALEHLGSLEAATAFVLRSLDCLRPGGVAVHTTEFNVSSESETLTQGDTVLFRRCDVEALVHRLRAAGHGIEVDLTPGHAPADEYVDHPPYQQEPHLRLALGGFVTTSLALLIDKRPCA